MSSDFSAHSLAHLKAITESIHDAIVSIDAYGKILSWNPAAENIFQYTAEEALGQAITIIIPERFRRAHEAGLTRIVTGGPRHVIGKTVELAGVRKDGSEVPIELSLSTWEIAGERFFGGIIRDVSVRKQADAAVRASEQRFRSITESANDAIVSADSQGRIGSWNKSAEQIFGYTADEVLRQPLTVIIPERFRKLHERGIKRVSEGGPCHVIGKTVELAGLHKDGREIPIELSLSTWESDGRKFFCGIIRDITERKKAQEELQKHKEQLAEKARKLRKANSDIRRKNDELKALSNKLAKYLSRQVYNSIFQGKKDVKIESYRKKLTVFFSDIEGFTELSDRLESEVLTSVLNKYLNEMTAIAVEYGGTIDKYIGDAIMIFFGDPDTLGDKRDALACVNMALKMRERIVELQREWDSLGMSKPLRVRMGINSGFCTVGNFGSEERLDYTIVGSQVNLASRLESLAEPGEILMSHSTHSLVREEIACEKKDEFKVKGFAYPVQAYRVQGRLPEIPDEERLKASLAGFRLAIDFEKLSYNDKVKAKELLEKAIAKLTQ